VIKEYIVFLKSYPINIILWKLKCIVFRIKIGSLRQWQQIIKGKKGIEIGGPSGVFDKDGYFPVYPFIEALDGVNFSKTTLWEGSLQEGNTYRYGNKCGHQFIAEGTNLSQIASERYDFVLSCNNLEHLANPLLAIFEWNRILKRQGVLILALPNKESNFDHRRPYTTFEHIVNDYENHTSESDLTHLNEILKLHDLKRDFKAKNFEAFKKRGSNNYENRCLHHHVFNLPLLEQLAEYAGMKVLLQHASKTDLYLAAQKH
jgi:SAM-dependent methyltransferase